MNAHAGRVGMGDGRGEAAVYELHGYGVGVGKGIQMVVEQNRGVEEGARGA